MRLIFRPLGQWPGVPTGAEERERAAFTAGWSDTLDVLDREVHALGAEEVVLQVDASERAMRIDGGIRADAKVNGPGVIIAFESKHGPLSYACDRFTGGRWRGYGKDPAPGWQCNVRAIALGLEALRKVDRYGIARSGEQYRGWSQLPPGRPMGPAMTIEEAAAFIAAHTDDPAGRAHDVAADPFFALVLFKDAAKRCHPDAGGDPADFRRLTEARDLLAAAQ